MNEPIYTFTRGAGWQVYNTPTRIIKYERRSIKLEITTPEDGDFFFTQIKDAPEKMLDNLEYALKSRSWTSIFNADMNQIRNNIGVWVHASRRLLESDRYAVVKLTVLDGPE